MPEDNHWLFFSVFSMPGGEKFSFGLPSAFLPAKY